MTQPGYGRIAKGYSINVNTEDTEAVRVTSMVQRAAPNAHLAEVSGAIYGTGIYDGARSRFISIEVATDSGGPWTALTPRTSDPYHVFPAAASAAGEPYCLVVEPEVWTNEGLWFRLTVQIGPDTVVDQGGAFAWDADIDPGTPATIMVPAGSETGDYTVSWDTVDGATGYELAEGVQQPDTTVLWGSYADVGDVDHVDIVDKDVGVYWYRVRSYNPYPNYSGARTSSNGCRVEQPGFRISPDLSWPNVDAMLDPVTNPRASSWPFAELEVVLTAPVRYKGRDTLIFESEGVRYKLPPEAIDSLGGSTRHIVKSTVGEVDWFMLTRQSTSMGDTNPEQTWSRPTANPRILS